MHLFDKDTEHLLNTLQNISPSEVKDYLQEQFKGGEPSFSGYIDSLLERKNLKRQDVLIRANLPQKYGYKLLTGESHTTDRDKILRICFSMEMTLKETMTTFMRMTAQKDQFEEEFKLWASSIQVP